MNKNETNFNQSDSHKKSFRLRYIISAFILLLIIAALVFTLLSRKPISDPASEANIRRLAAALLEKDINDLTDEDFAEVKDLSFFIHIDSELSKRIGGPVNRLSDIKLLSKFTNLQKLDLIDIRPPENEIPKWMEVLSKLGIYDLTKRYEFDLSPLEKLYNLEELALGGPIINIKPLIGLNNLTMLNLVEVPVSDIEPLKNLTKLQNLLIQGTQVSDITPLKSLTNLNYLSISCSPVTNLEPLKGLINLQELSLDCTKVTNLEFLKGMTNLKSLGISNLPISDFEPFESLKNLKYLTLVNAQVIDLNFLRGMTNLKSLSIIESPVFNLESIKRMTNLQNLYLTGCQNIASEQIEGLHKALPNLQIVRN